jgi:hypothetical protein
MKRSVVGVAVACALMMSFVLLAALRADDDHRDSRVREGFRIAPVHLTLRGRNAEKVGLGSYLVNAVAACNDCHTCPSYAPGHSPYGPPFGPAGGGDGRVNAANYLAGGVVFSPPGVTSPNLTPDPSNGLPEGNSLRVFKNLMRTGHDPDEPGRILQVMPWPVFRHMTDDDIEAIYQYLRAIPHAEPGQCVAPGQ